MKRAAEPTATRRVGVFGGTFDPPHLGHVSVAGDVADALDLDRVLWIPARRSPLKETAPGTPDAVRLEMVRAAASADPRFVVDGRELQRPPPSYTVDTLEALRDAWGDGVAFFLIVGIDQYEDFGRWREPDRIRELARVVVMDREGRGLRRGVGDDPRDAAVPVRRVDVSASDIRARVQRGVSITGLVPSGVEDVIEREGLYARR